MVLTNPDMLHVGILPQPRRLGRPVREPGGRGDRRGARLPRRVRLARRQRAAPAAADRGRVWHRAALPADLGHDRQPRRAGRAPDGPRGGEPDRRGRLAGAGKADRRVEPAADRPGAGRAARRSPRPPSCSARAGARGRAHDLLHQVAQGRRAAEPAGQRRPGRAPTPSWPSSSSPIARATPPSSGASWRAASRAGSCAR